MLNTNEILNFNISPPITNVYPLGITSSSNAHWSDFHSFEMPCGLQTYFAPLRTPLQIHLKFFVSAFQKRKSTTFNIDKKFFVDDLEKKQCNEKLQLGPIM